MANRGSSVLAQPSFTTEQRGKLKELDLVDAQIAELEGILPLIRAMLGRAAPLTEVCWKLCDIERPLRSVSRAVRANRVSRVRQSLARAHKAIGRLTKHKSKAAIEAMNRVIGADEAPTAVLMQGDIVQRTARAIEEAIQKDRLPPYRALMEGFLKHHNPDYPRSAGKPLTGILAMRRRITKRFLLPFLGLNLRHLAGLRTG